MKNQNVLFWKCQNEIFWNFSKFCSFIIKIIFYIQSEFMGSFGPLQKFIFRETKQLLKKSPN